LARVLRINSRNNLRETFLVTLWETDIDFGRLIDERANDVEWRGAKTFFLDEIFKVSLKKTASALNSRIFGTRHLIIPVAILHA